MHKDNEHSRDSDAKVSAAYEAVANESVPVNLDSKVLQLARTEARPGRSLRYLFSIRRPLAFAATLVLSLGIVMQFDDLLLNSTPEADGLVTEPTENSTGSSEISAVVDGSGKRLQEQARQGENVMSQGLLNKPMPSTVGGAEATGPASGRHCDDAQIATADLWWACILDLDVNGRHAAAMSERELLGITHPDFLPAR